jgi:hypothetical protein
LALPAATYLSAGIFGSAVLAPEAAPVAGAAYQGALTNVALRATNDVLTGSFSSPSQYGGSAIFGASTAPFTAGRGIIATAGITGASSVLEGLATDNPVSISQVGVNSFGAGAGRAAANTISSVPAFKPFAPILAPAVESFATYGVTAVTTSAFVKSDKNK